MNTTPPAWMAIKALFDATAELPPAQREAHLRTAELSEPDRAELRSLLAHHDRASGRPAFLAAGAAEQLAEAAPPPAPAAARLGQRLGPWQIVRAIGSGGMGEVFEARRADGSWEGRAAVKLLKRGMDSAAVLQRFALERQALARLSHPHIARLLDAGISDDGLPFFVMEHVDGQPIDRAVRALALPARLRLFLQLADAVAHAHRNLLVHRDLKPGNVLVDAEGQVKLLDFGIAKALDPLESITGTDAEAAPATLGGQRPYTPHHASPEQVRGEPVGTATDVYSLGVLLYQMLTGARPTGRQARSGAEAARSVLEEAPLPPSRLPPGEAGDPGWRLHRERLRGDLDNILLKALHKAVDQRYPSVEALAADVRAHLEGRPVSARPHSPLYVLRKFVERNRWAVLAGALGGLGLVLGLASSLLHGQVLLALGALGLAGGLIGAMVQARQAALARQQAEAHVQQLRRLSRELVVEYGDLITHLPGGRERKATMLAATVGYLERLLLTAEDDAALKAELGQACARLAELRMDFEFNTRVDPAAAAALAGKAAGLCQAAEAAAPGDEGLYRWWSVALLCLGRVEQATGEVQRAQALHQQAHEVLLRGLQRHPASAVLQRQQVQLLTSLVYVLYGWDRPHLNQPQAALDQLERIRPLCAAWLQAPDAATQAAGANGLAGVAASRALILLRQQQMPAARDSATAAVQQRRAALALEPHNRTWRASLAADSNLLAGLCLDLDDAAGALDVSAPTWLALERWTAEHPDDAHWPGQRQWLAFHHGRALLGTGQPAAALPVLQVSADWLQALVDAGQATPRQQARLVRTRLAQARAHGQAAAPGPAAAAWRAAQALLSALEVSDEPDVRRARDEAQATAQLLALAPA